MVAIRVWNGEFCFPLEFCCSPVTMSTCEADRSVPITESFDSKVVLSSLTAIAPILPVANEIESLSPRVAYLCT